MNIKSITVTPTLAQRWLQIPMPDGLQQRRVSVPHVRMLAAAMVDNRWQDTGDSIKLGPNECVLDGQHRLHAIVQAKTPQTLAVAFGVDPAAFWVIDDVRPRSVADRIRAMGQGYANAYSAVATQLYLIQQAQRGGPSPTQQKVSFSMLETVISDHKELIEWSVSVYPSKIEPGISSGGAPIRAALISAVQYNLLTRSEAEDLIKQVVSAACTPGSVARALRSLIASGASARDSNTRMKMALAALRIIERGKSGETTHFARIADASIETIARLQKRKNA